jgi:hypothetical protein
LYIRLIVTINLGFFFERAARALPDVILDKEKKKEIQEFSHPVSDICPPTVEEIKTRAGHQ